MINKITLKNFKASVELIVQTESLTVLAGLNGSGKSTLLQALAALRQSYDFQGKTNGLILGGYLTQLGKGHDVLSEGSHDAKDLISMIIAEGQQISRWKCRYDPDNSQLEFKVKPDNLPSFITTQAFQYLQADRITPHTIYPQAPQQARDSGFLGVRGEFTADYLARNGGKHLVRATRRINIEDHSQDKSIMGKVAPTKFLLDQVAGWMQYLSPGVRLKSTLLKGTDEVRLRFSYVGLSGVMDSNEYRPTNVGFGLTYCLPIVVACLAAPKGSLLLLENPEAHLHPQGQAALGTLLATCAMDGVQIIVETHSDHLLNGIRLAVKNKIITPDKVAMHFFSRDIRSGNVETVMPRIFTNGRLSNWPEGFFDQWDKSIDALLD